MGEDSGFQFTDSAVPRAYDEILVPRLFEPWALLLLDEADLRRNMVILDVATGPGTVARPAAKRIGPGGRVVGVDISRPMLEIANSKPSLPDAAPITYIEGPAAPLAVAGAVFDVVFCQQGLQYPLVIKDTIEAAGFRAIRIRRAALPLIFENGIPQAARALSATPLAPSLAALPAATRDELNAAIGARLAPLLREGNVGGDMTANIAVAHA